jgi:hypothetical protein
VYKPSASAKIDEAHAVVLVGYNVEDGGWRKTVGAAHGVLMGALRWGGMCGGVGAQHVLVPVCFLLPTVGKAVDSHPAEQR